MLIFLVLQHSRLFWSSATCVSTLPYAVLLHVSVTSRQPGWLHQRACSSVMILNTAMVLHTWAAALPGGGRMPPSTLCGRMGSRHSA